MKSYGGRNWLKEEAVQLFEVLRRPVRTEKNTALQAQGKYVFEAARQSNKNQIKEAVEKGFKVRVTQVNVMMVPGDRRRRGRREIMSRPWKKAVVTLAPGDKIELFEGV